MASRKRLFIQLGLVLLFVAAGAAALAVLALSKKPPTRKKPEVQAPIVQTITAKNEALTVTVIGEGTVSPLHEATLATEVAGSVIYCAPELVNGGSFKKGQVLMRIDPRDYRLAVTLAQAEVEAAETTLKVGEEEAAAAVEEWRLVNKDAGRPIGEPPPLVAKKPYLEQYRARLAAARAQLERARLDLKRTELTAPFDGRVVSKQVDLGQFLNRGQSVASVFSTQVAQIEVHLEDADLAWLKVPGFTAKQGQGSLATIRASFAGRDLSWQGRVVRALSKVDQRTRLVGVVVEVDHPYATLPPLSMGMFVKVYFQGKSLPSATILPRSVLRQGDVVWVVDKTDRLRFTKVKVARVEGSTALLNPGLPAGTKVVTSNLKAVSDGMAVRLAPTGG